MTTRKLYLSTWMLILVAVLVVSIGALSVSAADTTGACGASGSNLSWSLDTDARVLTISGTGDMTDYTAGSAPWLSSVPGATETFDGMTTGVSMTSDVFNNSAAIDGVTATVSDGSLFNIAADGTDKYVAKSASVATLYFADETGDLNTEKFVISFDYRMDGAPNSASILALNNREAGEKDEMRILSCAVSGNYGRIYFGTINDGIVLLDGIDYTNPQWIHFAVVVDPTTYNYEVYVDGVKQIYTTTDADATG